MQLLSVLEYLYFVVFVQLEYENVQTFGGVMFMFFSFLLCVREEREGGREGGR